MNLPDHMGGLDQSSGLTIPGPIGFCQTTLPRGFKQVKSSMPWARTLPPSTYRYFILSYVIHCAKRYSKGFRTEKIYFVRLDFYFARLKIEHHLIIREMQMPFGD